MASAKGVRGIRPMGPGKRHSADAGEASGSQSPASPIGSPTANTFSSSPQLVVTSNPAQPHTWAKTAWAAAFHQFKDDGEVTKECLPDLLRLAGHRRPEQRLVDAIAEQVTKYPRLSAAEVHEFLQHYEAELRAELRLAFHQCSQRMGGKVPVSQIEHLLYRKGYTPIPHAIEEVLNEAATEIGANTRGGQEISLGVFEKVVELLDEREGFCKSDLEVILQVFQQFDKNRNGVIDHSELKAMMEWHDFIIDENIVATLVSQPLQMQGFVTWKDFLVVMRKRVALEFDLAQKYFRSFDVDEDHMLDPGELMRLFSALGVTMIPETLVSVVEECDLPDDLGDKLDFHSFWKVLQVLKGREGFTLEEADELQSCFRRFDSSGTGRMPRKRAQMALAWLGYVCGPGTLGKANQQAHESVANSYLSEAQFTKCVRRHREAELRAIKKVFRSCTEGDGAGKLNFDTLQHAVKKVNRVFGNDCMDWIKVHRPGARLARKLAGFDQEDFRLIIWHCREKMRQRLQKNHGFSEVQLSRLRIEFVKYTKDGQSIEVSPKGLIKLFKALFPLAQSSTQVRDRLRKALENNNCKTSGLDWLGFLGVMRTYDDLVEEDREQNIQASLRELGVATEDMEEAQDALCVLDSEGSGELSFMNVQILVRSMVPVITEEQAFQIIERMKEVEAEAENEVGIAQKVRCLQRITESFIVEKRRRAGAHHKEAN
mmetsp:Transcript_159110/g.280919  ORF Transcript_159110/g.280919 Transcript_159110/m.280919 type:complete len:713 (+) Transcript_159110:72-2210(+)